MDSSEKPAAQLIKRFEFGERNSGRLSVDFLFFADIDMFAGPKIKIPPINLVWAKNTL